MDRREFLKSGSAAAAAALAPQALSQSNAAAPAAGRSILPINRNWRFSKPISTRPVR